MHGVEDDIDDVQQVIGGALNALKIAAIVFVQFAERFSLGNFGKTDDRFQRCA